MTDSREKALEKCIAHVKEFLSEYDGDGGSCNIRVCGKPDDPHFFALTKRFPYATPKPIPKKGAPVIVWGNGGPEKIRISYGETSREGNLLVYPDGLLRWPRNNSALTEFENWRVVGNGEEEDRAEAVPTCSGRCHGCAHIELPSTTEPCATCTTTKPSNWEAE
jgi:hypothetical protein